MLLNSIEIHSEFKFYNKSSITSIRVLESGHFSVRVEKKIELPILRLE